jgi:hypothetical protein
MSFGNKSLAIEPCTSLNNQTNFEKGNMKILSTIVEEYRNSINDHLIAVQNDFNNNETGNALEEFYKSQFDFANLGDCISSNIKLPLSLNH